HYGLLANGNRAANIAKARELLAMPAPVKAPEPENDEPCVLPRIPPPRAAFPSRWISPSLM
ncbi:MAG: hypothetical protein WA820_22120, partial [Bradyrhizobium sp.]